MSLFPFFALVLANTFSSTLPKFAPPSSLAVVFAPGLNNVIRDLTMTLYFGYGVKKIYGIQYGYEGFYKHPFVDLTPDLVSGIHHLGGTILGSSRGGF
eukprot:TRINITY_DN2531_c0_g1_i1.p2 TRINITY_DN2531_c0_g1~~TRINITY_DN2531_c0_g1_i1.p2  ORF type:complete len:98 (+),score=23.24 TRINITY_DN2531_c0_g1_i1:173-466(+)